MNEKPAALTSNQRTSRGHIHAEAFCLMWYRCSDCRAMERIWNSRDGVTPFGMSCASCGGHNMSHVYFGSDEYAPGHKLRDGQRFWRDGTPEEAVAIMQRRINSMRAEYPIEAEREARLLDECRRGTQDSGFVAGWPMLDVHREKLVSGDSPCADETPSSQASQVLPVRQLGPNAAPVLGAEASGDRQAEYVRGHRAALMLIAAWVDERYEAEVAHRPDVNIHKRTLETTWGQMQRKLEELLSGEPPSPTETTARPDLSEIATVVQAAAKHVESILARPGPYHPAFTALLELADRFKAPRPLVCPDGWRCKYPRLVGSIAQDCEYPNCDCGPPEKA